MRKTTQLLDKLSGEIANIYTKKTGLDLVTVQQMMDDETWFNGRSALSMVLLIEYQMFIKVAAEF